MLSNSNFLPTKYSDEPNKGGISSGVAGYLLDEDGIKINNSQLEIQMSVF